MDEHVIEVMESSDDDDDETSSLANMMAVEDILGRGRQEKSLGNLATKFAELLRNSPDGVMHLNKVFQIRADNTVVLLYSCVGNCPDGLYKVNRFQVYRCDCSWAP